MQRQGMLQTMAGGPSRAFRRGTRAVMMIVVALAVTLVGTLILAPSQRAQAATPDETPIISVNKGQPQSGWCDVRMLAFRTTSEENTAAQVTAQKLGWDVSQTSTNGSQYISFDAPDMFCGGDHRRMLTSTMRTVISVGGAIAIALVTSIALPEMIIGGFAELGITVARPVALAVAQCIGWGAAVLFGQLYGGNPAWRATAGAVFACVIGAIAGVVGELEKVRQFFTMMGSKIVAGSVEWGRKAVGLVLQTTQQIQNLGIQFAPSASQIANTLGAAVWRIGQANA